MAAKPRPDVDVPLFREDALIHTTRDIRTVGEMLIDVGHLTRGLLIDVDGDDAAALLRTWPTVAAAANDLWSVLPRHALDTAHMDRIAAMTESITSSMQSGWPGPGALDPRMTQIAQTLSSATKLVKRYSGEIPLQRSDVRQDATAARARTVQALYFATHAVSVALHQHGRDLYFDARDAGEPLQMSTSATPYAVAPTSGWLQRIQSCERIAGDYLRGRLLHDLDGEVQRPADDPSRLQRALTVWDIRAHRRLASNPTPGNLQLVTRTQGAIAGAGMVILEAAALSQRLPSPGSLEQLLSAVGESGQSWSNLGGRWTDLTTPTTGADVDLMRAAAEVRAACREITHDKTGMASLETIAAHPGLDHAARAILQSLEAGADLAPVVNEQAAREDLVGPARALSRRAHNDVENGVYVQQTPGTDTVWVSPADIMAGRLIPLPEPVAAGLRSVSDEVVETSQRGAAVGLRLAETATDATWSLQHSASRSREAEWQRPVQPSAGPSR